MKLPVMLLVGIALLVAPCRGANDFKDVPDNHWAKEAVDVMAQAGIMTGYADDTFNGDRHVSRYELCVALSKMVEFIQASYKPTVADKESEHSAATHWADPSMSFLKSEGFLPKDSLLLKDGDKQVTCQELGDALALVSAKLIELNVPPTGTPD